MAGGKSKVASAYAEVSHDDSLLKRGLAKIPSLIKAALGAAAIASGSQQASSNLKFDQLVRSTGTAAGWTTQQLQHMRDELRKTTAFSQTAITEAQSRLLTYTNVKGEQYKKALTTAANVSQVMGQDLASTADEIGALLADPLKAAEGGLEKYGILLTQAQQGQLRNAVASRDFAKAQEVVLGHFDRFKGAAQEASQTGVGGFDKLKNSLGAAFLQMTGALPDFGKMAAALADIIDKFMQLEMVKGIIDGVRAVWTGLVDTVTKFIDDNRADFEHWGELIRETVRNVADFFQQCWDTAKAVFKSVLDAMGVDAGSTWGSIKDTITAVLDEISLLTTNFGLTAQYVWVKIKLGAVQFKDAIFDMLAMVAVGWEALWNAVVAGAENAFDQVVAAFTGEKVKGFSAAVEEAFMKGGDRAMKRWNFGESQLQKDLRKEMLDLRAQMEANRQKVREVRAEQDKKNDEKKADEKRKLDTPGKGTPYIPTKPFQFEFTGFSELAKKIQTSIYPSEQVNLQKAGVVAAQQAANGIQEANGHLGKLVDAAGKGGAVFK